MKKRICIFGDSIVFGSYDLEGGWVERFRAFLNKNNWAYKVYNLGTSGDTTERLLERFENEAKVRRPDIIVFSVGNNDSQFLIDKNKIRIDLVNSIGNFNELLEASKNFTDKIVFVGLTSVVEEKINELYIKKRRRFYKNETLRKYNDAIASFAEDNNVPFIEVFNLLDEDDYKDGLHPNSKGHEKMFERIKDFLIENKIIEK